MAYEPVISDDLLNKWTDKVANDISNQLSQALKDLETPTNAIQTINTSPADRLLYELLNAAIHAKITKEDIITVLKQANVASNPKGHLILTDMLWLLGNDIGNIKGKSRTKQATSDYQNLLRVVKAIADENIISAYDLHTNLEFDMLHDAGLSSDEPQIWSRKMVRINTKALYTQRKFNLLREESEGFAKVLVLLHSLAQSPPPNSVYSSVVKAANKDLAALIGCFNLDANRVLDLVLEVYEEHPTADIFAEILRMSFKPQSIPHILGFKFQNCIKGDTQTPMSLNCLAAMLIKKKLLDINAILPHLSPSLDDIVKRAHQKHQDTVASAKSYGKVNLASKKNVAVEKESVEPEIEKENQVYGLLIGLVEAGAIDIATKMIQWFHSKRVEPFHYEDLTRAYCRRIQLLVSSLYKDISHAPLALVPPTLSAPTSVTPCHSYEDLISDVFPMVVLVGAQIHQDPRLFTTILRIVKHMKLQKDQPPDLDTHIKYLLTSSFLPALAMQTSCNPSSAFQLWDILSTFKNFETRYQIYQQWTSIYKTAGGTRNPEMLLVEAKAIQEVRKVMRRLTADSALSSARALTHIAHSNPIIVFRTMLGQIQSYDNLIQPVVESFKYITPLGMDVLSYVLVAELAKSSSSQSSMKRDGTNVSLWLTSLASFAGSFYRKFPKVELAGLLQYLIQRLKDWESVDLVVLSELLTKMGSCLSVEDISNRQLEALAGGPHLWTEEPMDPQLMNRRAIPRLRDALVKRELVVPICILICQMRTHIVSHEDGDQHLKLLGRVYDTCQMTLTQLFSFLNRVVDPKLYTSMLPRIAVLQQEYHVPMELIMTMVRPAIRYHDPILKNAPRSLNASQTNQSSSKILGDKVSESLGDSNASIITWSIEGKTLHEDLEKVFSSGDSSQGFSGLTKELYIVFWSLLLYDIYVPFDQYDAEIQRLKALLSANGTHGDNSQSAISERKKRKDKTNQLIDKLSQEQKEQVLHKKRVQESLEANKETFFIAQSGEQSTQGNEISALLQTCIIPRSLLSPEDALFCAKFMLRMHQLNAKEFSSLQYYHTTMLQLPSIVLCVTEREARNFGIFLMETLSLVSKWYSSASTYEDEVVHGKSGFALDRNDLRKKMTHSQFKKMYATWHSHMTTAYSATLSSSASYMSIRNTLVVCCKIIDAYPMSQSTAEYLLELTAPLTKEKREDLKVMAKRYYALLSKKKSILHEDKNLITPIVKAAKIARLKKQKELEEEQAKQPQDDEEGIIEESNGKEPANTAGLEVGELVEDGIQNGSSHDSAKHHDRDNSRYYGDRDSERTPGDDGKQWHGSGRYRGGNDRDFRGDDGRWRSGGRNQGDRDRDSKPPLLDIPHGEREGRGRPGSATNDRDSSGGRKASPGRGRGRDRNDRNDRSDRNERHDQYENEDTSKKRGRARESPGPNSAGTDSNLASESTEASLRRQLTEKKNELTSSDRQTSNSLSDKDHRNTHSNEKPNDNTRTTTEDNDTGKSGKKMVSLVSNSRKPKRDREPQDDANNAANGQNRNDQKRQRQGRGNDSTPTGNGDRKKTWHQGRQQHDNNGNGRRQSNDHHNQRRGGR